MSVKMRWIEKKRDEMTWNDVKLCEMTWNDEKKREMTWNDMKWHELKSPNKWKFANVGNTVCTWCCEIVNIKYFTIKIAINLNRRKFVDNLWTMQLLGTCGGQGGPKGVKRRPKGVEGGPEGVKRNLRGSRGTWGCQVETWGGREVTWGGRWGPKGVKGGPEGVEGGPEGVKGDLRANICLWRWYDMSTHWLRNDYAMIFKKVSSYDD